MKRKLWIVFEGIDGSGKTTQAQMLSDYLKEKGIKAQYSHVFDTRVGQTIRQVFLGLNSLSNTTEILLLCAARQAYLDEVIGTLETADVVITDRFFWSIMAMQGQTEKDMLLIDYIKQRIVGDRVEYVTYYIDTKPETCKERLNRKGERDRIELKSVEFHRRVYLRYRSLIDTNRDGNVVVFNGENSKNNIRKEIAAVTERLLFSAQ